MIQASSENSAPNEGENSAQSADSTAPGSASRPKLQLHNPDELYQALINTSPDAIVIMDLSGHIFYSSPATDSLLEISESQSPVSHSVLEWIDPEDHEKASHNIATTDQGTQADKNLYHMHTSKGRHFIAEINAAVLHDPQGSPSAIMVNIRDVTERWQAKEDLERSEKRFRSVVEASPMGMHFYRLEADGRLILEGANPGADSILKFHHADWFEKTMEEVFPGLVETDVPNIYRQLAIQGGQWHTDQVDYDENNVRGAFEVTAFQSSPGRVVVTFTDITQRKQAEHNLRLSLERMGLLAEIDRVIIAHDEVQVSMDALLSLITDYFHADVSEIMVYDKESDVFNQISGIGFQTGLFQVPCKSVGSTPGLATMTGRPLCLPNLYQLESVRNSPFYAQERLVSGYTVPLITHTRVWGVLQLFYRTRKELPEESIAFLEALGNQVAIAMEKTSLWEKHQQTLRELTTAYETTLEGWVYALDLRDQETEHHTRRVTELTVAMAREVGITSDEDLANVRRGALLHDIGKIGIPDNILHKPGPLTPDEWEIMRRHPGFAYNMLRPIDYLRGAIDIPYCHHERWDGSGYPRGLRGSEIPLAARIFAIADVWDALASNRPYRSAWPKENVVAYLVDNSGKLFDPMAVKAFLNAVPKDAF